MQTLISNRETHITHTPLTKSLEIPHQPPFNNTELNR